MDIMLLRSIITVACFIAFIGIVYWAYNGRQKDRFSEAANLPFADDDMQQRTLAAARTRDAAESTRSADVIDMKERSRRTNLDSAKENQHG